MRPNRCMPCMQHPGVALTRLYSHCAVGLLWVLLNISQDGLQKHQQGQPAALISVPCTAMSDANILLEFLSRNPVDSLIARASSTEADPAIHGSQRSGMATGQHSKILSRLKINADRSGKRAVHSHEICEPQKQAQQPPKSCPRRCLHPRSYMSEKGGLSQLERCALFVPKKRRPLPQQTARGR